MAAQGLPDGLRVSGLRCTDLGATPLLTDSLVLEWRPDIPSRLVTVPKLEIVGSSWRTFWSRQR